MSEIVLVRYLFQEEWAPLKEVVANNAEQFSDIYDVSSEKELLTIIDNSPAVLVIAGVTGKEALASTLNFLKGQRRVLKESNVKFSAVNFLNNKQVEAALMKLGCQEVMEPTMREKALKFKIDFWKKALSVGQKKQDDVKITLKDKQAGDAQAKADANPIKWIEPMKCVDDMWIMKSTADAKKVLTRWMVKVMGPSPFVAQWVEVPGQKGVWKFNFKEGARESFHSGDGDWYFRGDQKPEFVWKENLWMISGINFQLFYQEADGVSPRFVSGPKGIDISKNSSYALSREKAIVESFDQEVLIKKGIIADDSKTEIEKEERGDGLLTQDMSGQEAIDTKYRGATNGSPDEQDEEKKKLAIDAKTAGRLKGKSSTDDMGAGHYDGDVDRQTAEEKKNQRHNAQADRMENSHGDSGVDNVGPDKYKGKIEHAHTDRKSNYGGTSETDDLGSDKWSNAKELTPAQKKEKAARERGEYSEEAQSPYAGESSTDDLGPAHWEGKNSADAKKKKAEDNSSDWQEERKGALAGKGSTDDLGEGHYSGPNSKKKHEEVEEKPRAHLTEIGAKKQDSTTEQDKAAAKKKEAVVGTDDLGAAHYSGKIAKSSIADDGEQERTSTAEKAKKPLSGKSDTDDLGADHYGGKVQTSAKATEVELDKPAAQQAKPSKAMSGKSTTDDLGGAHYKGKQGAAAASEADQTEEATAETGRPASVARAKEMAAAEAPKKKINKLDELFPEGNAEDPRSDVLPKAKEEAFKVDVPMERSGPRLVVNNAPVGVPKAGPAPATDPLVAVATDDGNIQVSNDQVTVKAFLKKKSQPAVEHIVHVDDFFDNTVIVKMSQGVPGDGESVSLHISFEYQKRSKRINVEGACVSVDEDGEGQHYCTLELQAADVKVFEQFMTLYRLRQQHVTQFLKAAKGY